MIRITQVLLLFCLAFGLQKDAFGQLNTEAPDKNFPEKGWKSFNQQLELSSGLFILKLNYPQISPLLQSGLGIDYGINYKIIARQFYTQLDIGLSTASLVFDSYGLSADQAHIQIDIRAKGGYAVLEHKKQKLFLGATMYQNIHQFYFPEAYNASLQYLNTFMIGLNVYYTTPVSLIFWNPKEHSPFVFTWDFDLPLTGSYSMPPYNGFYNFAVPDRSFTDDNIVESVAIGDFISVKSKLQLDWYMKNSNALRLTYGWSFDRFNPPTGRINKATHTINFSLLVKLDRNTNRERLKHYGY